MTLSEMMKVSLAMPLLLALSLLVVGFALERFYTFWFAETLPSGLWSRLRAELEDGDRQAALAICKNSRSPFAQAVARLLAGPAPSPDRLESAFGAYRQRLMLRLSRRVGFFGTASFVAPLIGLFGTVLGIMRAFHDLAIAGAGGPTVVAAGISEALVATAAGIGVAIASAFLYNYFSLALKSRLNTLDLWVYELSDLLAS